MRNRTDEQKAKKSAADKAYRDANIERIRESERKRYAANPQMYRDRANTFRDNHLELVRKRDRERYAENPDYKIEKTRQWRGDNPEKARALGRKWYAENTGKASIISRRWKAAHPENTKAHMRKWSSSHKEKRAILESERRARKNGCLGKHTESDIAKLFDLQGGKCAACKAEITKSGKTRYQVDHVMPLARSGSNGPENLQLLCKSCNCRKYTMDPAEWAALHGRLFV